MLSTLSISFKLIAIVSFLLISLASTGLLAIVKMQALNDRTVDIATNWLPSVRVLGELPAEFLCYRSDSRLPIS
jgi:methyl-accepting chemotaxis protein